jgi:hypothetical protein
MKRLSLMIFLAAILAGCSSIISKTDYPVSINTSPDGAAFKITNSSGLKVHSGITPAMVSLKSSKGYMSGESYTIEVSKDGFYRKSFQLSSSVDGWYFGNIIFGGLIGMIFVDPVTGAMWNLPPRVDISLDPSLSLTLPKTITIANIDTATKEQLARMQRIN